MACRARHRTVKRGAVFCIAMLVASCTSSGTPQLGCASASCPAPRPPRDTLALSLDDTPAHNLRNHRLGRIHTFKAVVRVGVELGTSIGTFVIGEAGPAWGSGDGLGGVRVLKTGSRLVDGQVLTFDWTPAASGRRSLVIQYTAAFHVAAKPAEVRVGAPMGDILIA